MQKMTILTILCVVSISFFVQGCQSQNEKAEAAAKEKQKKFWKDATPEKYMEGKGKAKKPYWEK